MKLYPKKLRSIEDLEQEKKHLLRKKRRLDKEGDLFSLEGLLGKEKEKGKEKVADAASLLEFLPISNPLVGMLANVVMQRFANRGNKRKQASADDHKEDKPNKNVLLSVGKELVGSYLKWKAVELSCKGLKFIVKKQKKKEKETSPRPL